MQWCHTSSLLLFAILHRKCFPAHAVRGSVEETGAESVAGRTISSLDEIAGSMLRRAVTNHDPQGKFCARIGMNHDQCDAQPHKCQWNWYGDGHPRNGCSATACIGRAEGSCIDRCTWKASGRWKGLCVANSCGWRSGNHRKCNARPSKQCLYDTGAKICRPNPADSIESPQTRDGEMIWQPDWSPGGSTGSRNAAFRALTQKQRVPSLPSECMWNDRETCDTSPDKCAWSSQHGCVTTGCAYWHNDVECNGPCIWKASGQWKGQCVANICADYTRDPEQCRGRPGDQCLFSERDQKCLPNDAVPQQLEPLELCFAAATDRDVCDAMPDRCRWHFNLSQNNAVTGCGGNDCFGKDKALCSGRCTWKVTGSFPRCVENVCLNYNKDPEKCSNRPNSQCWYSNVLQQCLPENDPSRSHGPQVCASVGKQRDRCDELPDRCMWNFNVDINDPLTGCFGSDCTSNGKAECGGECTWKSAGPWAGMCIVDVCSSYHQRPDKCKNRPGAQCWYSTEMSQCLPQTFSEMAAMSDALATPIHLVDAQGTSVQPFGLRADLEAYLRKVFPSNQPGSGNDTTIFNTTGMHVLFVLTAVAAAVAYFVHWFTASLSVPRPCNRGV